jgi:hypothetical protein
MAKGSPRSSLRITKVDTGSFRMTVPGSPLFIPEQARSVISEISRDYLELALLAVAGHVSERAPRNFGNLAQSFMAHPAGETGGIEILGLEPTTGLTGRVFSSLPYAIVMEEGRRPGKPISRAGQAAIMLWVRRKLGLSGKDARSAGYAIIYSIQKKGIEGRHYARAGFAAAKPELETIFNQLNAAIAEGLSS